MGVYCFNMERNGGLWFKIHKFCIIQTKLGTSEYITVDKLPMSYIHLSTTDLKQYLSEYFIGVNCWHIAY